MSILLFALIPYRTLLFFPPHTSCAENALYTIFIQPSSDSSSIVASFNRHAHICLSKGRLRNQESCRPRCSTALLDPAMKVFSSICTFNYSWDEVSTANWRKYCPWNDKSTHVVGVDTLSRRVDPDTGIVSATRGARKLQAYLAKYLMPCLIVTHRATYHMQSVCTTMDLFTVWREPDLTRLRSIVR